MKMVLTLKTKLNIFMFTMHRVTSHLLMPEFHLKALSFINWPNTNVIIEDCFVIFIRILYKSRFVKYLIVMGTTDVVFLHNITELPCPWAKKHRHRQTCEWPHSWPHNSRMTFIHTLPKLITLECCISKSLLDNTLFQQPCEQFKCKELEWQKLNGKPLASWLTWQWQCAAAMASKGFS